MKSARVSSLEQALALMRAPALLATLRARPLPDDTLTLLRLAASDEELLSRTAIAAGETREHLVEAAVFFVQQVLFAPGSDSYRVLGVNPDATDARIKENYRWLVKWLHPDRNTDEWDAIYADRVNRAWQDLRSADRRGDYDQQRAGRVGTPDDAAAAEFPVRVPAMVVDEPMLSARTVRHMPMLVFAGLGVFAVLMLGLLWYAQSIAPPEYVAFDDPPAQPPVPEREALASEPPQPLPITAPAAPEPVQPTPEVPAPSVAAPAEAVAANAPPEIDPEVIEREVQRRLAVALAKAERELRAAAPGRSVTRSQVEEPREAAATAPPAARTVAPATPAPAAAAPSPRETAAVVPQARPARPAPAAPEPAEIPIIDDVIAADVLLRFRDAYARGDLDRMMALFARSATNNRGGIDAIRKDYRALFNSSESRELLISNTNWLAVGDTATILSSFEAVVVPNGGAKARRVRGDIRFDLRREDGALRIVRLLHENAGG